MCVGGGGVKGTRSSQQPPLQTVDGLPDTDAAPPAGLSSSSGGGASYRDHVDERGLPRVLQAHQRQLHLLLPEQGAEPVQEPVDERQHLGLG